MFTLEDLAPASDVAELTRKRWPDATFFDVRTANRTRQARVRIPAGQSTSPQLVLDALNRQVARLGRNVVEGRMLAVDGYELTPGRNG